MGPESECIEPRGEGGRRVYLNFYVLPVNVIDQKRPRPWSRRFYSLLVHTALGDVEVVARDTNRASAP